MQTKELAQKFDNECHTDENGKLFDGVFKPKTDLVKINNPPASTILAPNPLEHKARWLRLDAIVHIEELHNGNLKILLGTGHTVTLMGDECSQFFRHYDRIYGTNETMIDGIAVVKEDFNKVRQDAARDMINNAQKAITKRV